MHKNGAPGKPVLNRQDKQSNQNGPIMPTNRKPPLGYRKVAYEKSMCARRPDLAKDFHPTKNGEMTPDIITPGINKNIWWKCHVCAHEWQAYGHTRIREKRNRYPSCSKRTVTPTNNLAVLRPSIAAEFHPTKNGTLKPESLMPGSDARVWWLGKCGHEWETRVKDRKGKGCPYCSGRLNSGVDTLNGYPLLLAELHPREVNRTDFRSAQRCWWRCSTCSHDWQAVVGQRKIGTGCPACAGQVVTAKNCLAATHPNLAAEFHPTKNDFTAHEVLAGTNKRVWWQCGVCNAVWSQTGTSRVRGSGCPQCACGGYNQAQPGVLYVLVGPQYGKIGISNLVTIKNRITHHQAAGLYTNVVTLFSFDDGADALRIETS
jgi:hypothetical protein